MAEYINKDKEKRLLHIEYAYAAEQLLDEIPAADVATVVHGRWNNITGYKTRKVCSECGWDVPEYGKFYSYCPNCGAKMDGGAENESKEM